MCHWIRLFGVLGAALIFATAIEHAEVRPHRYAVLFEKIQEGMSYAEVEGVMAEPGQSSAPVLDRETWTWKRGDYGIEVEMLMDDNQRPRWRVCRKYLYKGGQQVAVLPDLARSPS